TKARIQRPNRVGVAGDESTHQLVLLFGREGAIRPCSHVLPPGYTRSSRLGVFPFEFPNYPSWARVAAGERISPWTRMGPLPGNGDWSWSSERWRSCARE